MTSSTRFDSLISKSTIGLLALSAILPLIYRLFVPGGFSTDTSDWGSFGSYIGGILTPAVSFVALLALLRTISIQRTMLKQQSEEFSKLNKLQLDTLEEQKKNSEVANDAYLNEKIVSYKSILLKSIESQMSFYTTKHTIAHDVSMHLNEKYSSNPYFHETIDESLKKRDAIARRVKALNEFFLLLSLEEFSSIQEAKNFYSEGFARIQQETNLSQFGE